MAQARAVIDIVAAEADAHQFLEQVGFLVRSFSGAETGERARAVLVADFLQPRSGALQRLLPGRGPEMRPRVCRIDNIVGVLGYALFADQRLREPVRMVNVIETE